MAVSARTPRSMLDIHALNYNFHVDDQVIYVPLSNPNGLLSLSEFKTTNAKSDSENVGLSLIYTAYYVEVMLILAAGYSWIHRFTVHTWSAFNTLCASSTAVE